MPLDPYTVPSTAIIIFLEFTLYCAYAALIQRGRKGNILIGHAILLHLAQRRIVLDAVDYPGWLKFAIRYHGDGPHEPSLEREIDYTDCIAPPLSVRPHPINITNVVALHDGLLQHALAAKPQLERHVRRDYFAMYEPSTTMMARLTPDTTQLLSELSVWDIYSNRLSLNPLAAGIPDPDRLSPDPDSPEGELWYLEYPHGILLYASTERDTGDARGLVLDQRTGLARWYHSIFTSHVPQHWALLEEVLRFWLDMIEGGRWLASPATASSSACAERAGDGQVADSGEAESISDYDNDHEPWKVQSFIAKDIERTVLVWEAYIALLSAKLGRPLLSQDPMVTPSAIVETGALGYEAVILTKLRRPNMEHIFPGLQIPTEEMLLSSLRTASKRRDDEELYGDYGVLLFHEAKCEASLVLLRPSETDSFYARYQMERVLAHYVVDDRCGVYLTPGLGGVDKISFIGSRTLDGQRGFAWGHRSGRMEASLLDERRDVLADAAGVDMYLGLEGLIALAYDMVLHGKWRVDNDGVMGDAEETWSLFDPVW